MPPMRCLSVARVPDLPHVSPALPPLSRQQPRRLSRLPHTFLLSRQPSRLFSLGFLAFLVRRASCVPIPTIFLCSAIERVSASRQSSRFADRAVSASAYCRGSNALVISWSVAAQPPRPHVPPLAAASCTPNPPVALLSSACAEWSGGCTPSCCYLVPSIR